MVKLVKKKYKIIMKILERAKKKEAKREKLRKGGTL